MHWRCPICGVKMKAIHKKVHLIVEELHERKDRRRDALEVPVVRQEDASYGYGDA